MTFRCLKLKKAVVPCGGSWILRDSTRVVEAINNLNHLRSKTDKTSPLLLLPSFDFLTVCIKIDLVDLKVRMRVLINQLFNRITKLRRFKFLMVRIITLNLLIFWLKNKAEIHLFEDLHRFKVAEASNLISWLDFLLDHFFLYSGQGV
jgi:hypothetical protein